MDAGVKRKLRSIPLSMMTLDCNATALTKLAPKKPEPPDSD